VDGAVGHGAVVLAVVLRSVVVIFVSCGEHDKLENMTEMSVESMMWVRDSICVYVLPYHSIFLHTHLGKSGKCRLEPAQTATTSSILCRRHGPIWPKLERHVVSCRHVTTCRRHFQLSFRNAPVVIIFIK
jgi:hypothetical protein